MALKTALEDSETAFDFEGAIRNPQILDKVYRMAASALEGNKLALYLDSKDLAHSTLLGLLDKKLEAQSIPHLLRIVYMRIRHQLVHIAGARNALRRNGREVALDRVEVWTQINNDTVLILSQALKGLQDMEPRKAHALRLFFFRGLSVPEIAAIYRVNERIVKRDMRSALEHLRLQLRSRLETKSEGVVIYRDLELDGAGTPSGS